MEEIDLKFKFRVGLVDGEVKINSEKLTFQEFAPKEGEEDGKEDKEEEGEVNGNKKIELEMTYLLKNIEYKNHKDRFLIIPPSSHSGASDKPEMEEKLEFIFLCFNKDSIEEERKLFLFQLNKLNSKINSKAKKESPNQPQQSSQDQNNEGEKSSPSSNLLIFEKKGKKKNKIKKYIPFSFKNLQS